MVNTNVSPVLFWCELLALCNCPNFFPAYFHAANWIYTTECLLHLKLQTNSITTLSVINFWSMDINFCKTFLVLRKAIIKFVTSVHFLVYEPSRYSLSTVLLLSQLLCCNEKMQCHPVKSGHWTKLEVTPSFPGVWTCEHSEHE